MGSGIAQSLAQSGVVVRCYDVSETQLDRARTLTLEGRYGLAQAVARGKLTQPAADAAQARLAFTPSMPDALEDADLVIEAVPEDLALKIGLFRDLDGAAPAHAILASNTSGLPIAAMAAATARPDRVVGWHWASPPPVMKFAEIVAHASTSQATIDTVCAAAEACGKHPVVVRDNPFAWGHAANRVFAAMAREARLVVQEGLVDGPGLDRLMQDAYGWPVGPFGLTDGAAEGWGDGHQSSIAVTIGRPPTV